MKQLNLDLGQTHEERYGSGLSMPDKDEEHYPSFTYSGEDELELPECGKMVIEFEEGGSSKAKRDGEDYYTCTIKVRKILGVEAEKKDNKEAKAGEALDAIKEALESADEDDEGADDEGEDDEGEE
jgi:hypothetical protein